MARLTKCLEKAASATLRRHQFEGSGFPTVVLFFNVVLVIIALRAGFLSRSRRSGGCSMRRGTRGRFVGCGLIRAAV